MTKFQQMLLVARAISDDVEIRFRPTPEVDHWICSVFVGKDVILFQSPAGQFDDVLDAVFAKLKTISQRMHAVIVLSEPPPPLSPILNEGPKV